MSSRTLQWLSLVGIIWLQSINGTNSNFPAYSSQLKHLLSMSQLQLNNLAFASDAGKLLGWFSGVATIYLPLWLVLIIGSSLGLLGYGLQYLFLTDRISSLSYGHIFVLTVVAGNSICWINTVCYVVAIRNFPSDYRQVAVGLTTSYLGLSAKIYTDIVDAAFSSSPIERAKAYLLLNSILPMIVCVIAAPLARELDVGRPRNMGVGIITMFVITMATGVYAVISSLQSISGKLSPSSHAIGIGVFLLAPLVVPVAEKIIESVRKIDVNAERKKRKVFHFTIEESEGEERVDQDWVKDRKEVGEVGDESGDAEKMENGRLKEIREEAGEVLEIGIKEEIGVKEMLKRLNFWLYFLVYLFGATLGLVFLNNLGQIAESRGYSGTSSLVSLSSSFGFFGRLMPSFVDYYFSRTRYTMSRQASIVAVMAPTAGAFFLLVNNSNLSLHMSTAAIGVCCGAITSIAVSTTTELFGTKNFSVNHNVVVANIPIGSFLFGYMAAMLYHKEGNEDGKCMGMECYRITFITWGSFCLLGTFLALILYARTRKFYSQKV